MLSREGFWIFIFFLSATVLKAYYGYSLLVLHACTRLERLFDYSIFLILRTIFHFTDRLIDCGPFSQHHVLFFSERLQPTNFPLPKNATIKPQNNPNKKTLKNSSLSNLPSKLQCLIMTKRILIVCWVSWSPSLIFYS